MEQGDRNSPVLLTAEFLHSILSYQSLMEHFRTHLPKASLTLNSPIRQTHTISPSSSLLLMPCWSSSPTYLPYIGIKLLTYFPNNSPGIHATYQLFGSISGQTLATIDGTTLTLYRTASVSGLASKILSRNDSQVLVMIGAGALAPHLIKAHLSARPSLRKVIIWNRTMKKADDLAAKLRDELFSEVGFESGGELEDIIEMGDIVSCATNSEVALVMGKKLKVGAHLDLVGSFRESMRECDDEAIRRGKVFVDNEGALVEAGELVGAFERRVIRKDDIAGNLVELINGDKIGRINAQEITVFKSVGSALVDILAAQLAYETYLKKLHQS